MHPDGTWRNESSLSRRTNQIVSVPKLIIVRLVKGLKQQHIFDVVYLRTDRCYIRLKIQDGSVQGQQLS